jgi:hypothetical protein
MLMDQKGHVWFCSNNKDICNDGNATPKLASFCTFLAFFSFHVSKVHYTQVDTLVLVHLSSTTSHLSALHRMSPYKNKVLHFFGRHNLG